MPKTLRGLLYFTPLWARHVEGELDDDSFSIAIQLVPALAVLFALTAHPLSQVAYPLGSALSLSGLWILLLMRSAWIIPLSFIVSAGIVTFSVNGSVGHIVESVMLSPLDALYALFHGLIAGLIFTAILFIPNLFVFFFFITLLFRFMPLLFVVLISLILVYGMDVVMVFYFRGRVYPSSDRPLPRDYPLSERVLAIKRSTSEPVVCDGCRSFVAIEQGYCPICGDQLPTTEINASSTKDDL